MAKIASSVVCAGADFKKGSKVTLEQVIPKDELMKPFKTARKVAKDELIWIKVDKLEDARGRSSLENFEGEEATMSLLLKHVDLAFWRNVLDDIKKGENLAVSVETYE
jgi:hypothetical protein